MRCLTSLRVLWNEALYYNSLLHCVRRCVAPPEHSKIMPVYSDYLFLIYSCVTVSEHHNFVKRELMKETQPPSPLKSSKGCTYKLWCAIVPARPELGEQSPADPCPCPPPAALQHNTSLLQTVLVQPWSECSEEYFCGRGMHEFVFDTTWLYLSHLNYWLLNHLNDWLELL